MSDTKYNFDDYIFDNVLEDTYLAIKDVRENIDKQVKETREIDFDYNPYEGRDEREKLDGVITKNIVDSIKDGLYDVDFENKVMRGVNVEASHQRLCLLIVKVVLIELVESLKLIPNIMAGVMIRERLVLKLLWLQYYV